MYKFNIHNSWYIDKLIQVTLISIDLFKQYQ